MTGDRMNGIRSELGLTQAQLAALMGGKASMISDYENQRRVIPAKMGMLLECLIEINNLGGNIELPINRAKLKEARPS